MRDIEDLFKDSLKDHQLPYDAKAWSKMSKKLDATTPGLSKTYKWMFGAASIVAVIATFAYLTPKEQTVQAERILTEEVSNESNEDVLIPESVQKELKPTKQEMDKNLAVIKPIDCCEENGKIVEETEIKILEIDTPVKTELQKPVYREVAIETTISSEGKSPLHFSTPTIQCLNTTILYSNVNNESIYVLSPLELLEEVAANETLEMKLDEKGIYQIGTLNKNQNFKAATSFTVHEAETIQLTAGDYLDFKNGLPELTIKAFSDGEITWEVNKERVSKNGKVESFYLFEKGNYTINATTRDINGCESSDKISFFMEKNYNLLAVNAFTPNSFDDRNTTFMPFALTKRNTPFKMIIIDPSNGAVIFETSNSSQAWSGINGNTGELVKENTSFVWKVVLQNPEQGESPEYMGTVVRL